MAKKTFSGSPTSFSDINKFIGEFDKDGSLLTDYNPAKVETWASTGCYILNACMSGSLFGGIPAGKIVTISGDPKTGKSYVVISAVRELQRMGYFMLFFDTENSATIDRFMAQGCDPSMIRIVNPDSVNDITVMVTQMTESLLQTQQDYAQKNKKLSAEEQLSIPKIGIVIDSISALTGSKQLNDAIEGNLKTDMGSTAREIRQLFNIITPRIGKLGIPVICTAHEYEADEGYQKVKRVSGGKGAMYMSSIIVSLRKRIDRDKETKIKNGIIVRAEVTESRFSTQRPVEFYINFHNGVNPYYGLNEYISWKVCGIDKGKMVEYTDIYSELLSKKIISDSTATVSTADLRKCLSIPKREALAVSLEHDIDAGWITITNGKSPTIVLPDLFDYCDSKDLSLLDGDYDTNTIKEYMIKDGTYDPLTFTQYLQHHIDAGDIYIVGYAPVNPERNQKFKLKKDTVTAIQNKSYQYHDVEVQMTHSAVVSYNDNIEQYISFTDKMRADRSVNGVINPINQQICMPNATSTQYVVKHLNSTVPPQQLLSARVFTEAVLTQINNAIIVPMFSYGNNTDVVSDEDRESDNAEALYENIINTIVQ